MQGAVVLVRAGLGESILVHKSGVVQSSRFTVCVIMRTELPVGCAGCATGYAVRIAGPGPPHSVAHANIDGVRHELEFVSFWSHCHIENLAPCVSLPSRSLASVLINDVHRCNDSSLRD